MHSTTYNIMYNYYSVFTDYHQDSMLVYVNIVIEVNLHNRIHSMCLLQCKVYHLDSIYVSVIYTVM